MDRMDCDKMFIAIVETGNFTRAAKRLGTSFGQASKLISKLETDLSVTLLRRTTRSIT
ncbi:helix-turn-helix domain-containing protein, partial [Pseudomonas syringae]|uniref:helix-turn-helix domain-containing protein n=1 Tax=Pseudomonas syringae TaxID=317 RepID=UPI0034D617C6